MLHLHFTYDPVANIYRPLGFVHRFNQITAMSTEYTQAGFDIAGLKMPLEALNERGVTPSIP
ncbi:MAG: hypothetical protein Q4G41_00165 [Coriobacteriales bacterium]|nr:hypothetical protein [Coriobacteriales bacterium]